MNLIFMVFSDLFYPDNPKREKRAGELSADITVSISGLHQNKIDIENALKGANEIIIQALSKYDEPIPKEIKVDLAESWVVSVVELVATAVTYRAASYGLHRAGLAFMLRNGQIGAAAFARQLGLPAWFRVGKVLGTVAAMLMVTAVLDSIFGAIRRSKLRDIIHQLIPSRIQFKKAELINHEILIPLRTLIATVKILEGRIPRDELVKIINDTIAEEHRKLDLITDTFVKSKLKQLDNSRGSWTNED